MRTQQRLTKGVEVEKSRADSPSPSVTERGEMRRQNEEGQIKQRGRERGMPALQRPSALAGVCARRRVEEQTQIKDVPSNQRKSFSSCTL